MSPMNAFLGLLALAYFGATAFRRSGQRWLGMPSGTEFLLLGFLLGPGALGIIDAELATTFEPLVYVGLGWLALSTGLRFATSGHGRGEPGVVIAGVLLGLFTAALIFGTTFYVAWRFAWLSPTENALFSLSAALVGSETSPFALNWVLSRQTGSERMKDVITTVGHTDELVAIGLLAYILATLPSPTGIHLSHPALWAVLTFVFGAVLGGLGALLLGKSLARAEAMSFLLGASVLGAGLAAELGLAFPAVTFALGLTLQLFSPHRKELAHLVASSEEAVLFPLLVLAGVRIHLPLHWPLTLLIVVALLCRLLGKYLSGLWLARRERAPTGLGLSLASSGALAIALALTISLAKEGPVGDAVLIFAAVATMVGDLTSPPSLRRALEEPTAQALDGSPT